MKGKPLVQGLALLGALLVGVGVYVQVGVDSLTPLGEIGRLLPFPAQMVPRPTARFSIVGSLQARADSSFASGVSIAPVPELTRSAPPLAAVPAAPVGAAGGGSPANALTPSDTLQTLEAGASAWYRIGHGGVHMDVALRSDPSSNTSLAIYAPNNFERPIGHGTPYKNDPSILVWAGGHWKSEGDWFALVHNSNSTAIRYKLTSAVRDISNKTCNSYWEYIGPNLTYWTDCK